MKFRGLALRDLLRSIHPKDDLVAEPVGNEIYQSGENEKVYCAIPASDHVPHQDKENR
jgi:hypothetical protein